MKIDFSEQRQRHQPRWTAPASFLSLLAFQRYLASACGALFLLSMLVTIGVAADSTTDPSTPTTAAACPIPRCALSTDDKDMDYFPYKAIPTISSFSVVYYPSYKVLTETRTQTQFVLYQCGTSRPNANPTAGFSPSAKFFEVPLKTVAVDESISAGYLELLGQRHAIRFFDVSYVSSPCMLRMANEGQIETFESSYGNATKRAEQIAQVDAYFASNVADPNSKAIPQSSSSDDTLLNRSEWLKFYAYFFNKEFAAMDLWTGIKNRYGQFRLAATEAAALQSTKPSVGFVTYQAPSSWSPAGSLSISAASYKKDIVEDGGASFPIQADASWPLEKSDEFLSALASAQLNVLLDESYYDNPTVVGLGDVLTAFRLNASSSTTAFPFLGTSAVWREDARGSLKTTSFGVTYADDWFEDAQVESDALLLDFIRIVHPTLYEQLKASIINSAPGEMRIQRLWFRNMGANESVQFETAAQCTDLDAPPLPLLVRESTQPFHCPDYFYESSSPLPAWAIALIAVGGVAFVVIIVLFVIGFRRHRDLQYKYSKLAMEMQIRGQESKATV